MPLAKYYNTNTNLLDTYTTTKYIHNLTIHKFLHVLYM